MAVNELACPNCGAPLKVEVNDEATTHCPYCETEVVLPAELRPPIVKVISISSRTFEPPAREN